MYRFLVTLFYVALHMSSKSMGAPSEYEPDYEYKEQESVIFNSRNLPEYSSTIKLPIQVKMPESCAGENFCFEKGEYPEEAVQQLLEKLPMLSIQGGTGSDLPFRDGFESPECATNTTFVDKPIYYIVDQNDKTRAVVQSENFTQIYSAKWCEHPGRITYDTPHFLKDSHALKTFKIECANTYMNFDFIVLTDEGKAEMVKAKNGIPVCCRCQYSEP